MVATYAGGGETIDASAHAAAARAQRQGGGVTTQARARNGAPRDKRSGKALRLE